MGQNWESFISGLKGDVGKNVAQEVKGLLSWAQSEKDSFVVSQSEKMQKCLIQLAAGQITAKQFKKYMEDITTLGEIEIAKTNVARKTSAQRLVTGVTNVLLGKLTDLLK